MAAVEVQITRTMKRKQLILGTRGSRLALWQANFIKEQMEEEYGDIAIRIQVIKTTGDKISQEPLADIGGKGLFLKEIEEALLAEKVDIGVHSMKDVPYDLPHGLKIGAILKREDARDVFISEKYTSLFNLPKHARIGTSSVRRQSQLKNFRPDFEIVPLRGNVETRLKKLNVTKLSGIILASAGMKRLGFIQKISEYLAPSLMLPAVGQGAIGLEVRQGDERVQKLIGFLNDEKTAYELTAEREFSKVLGGDCKTPIAAFAEVDDDRLKITGMVASLDGRELIRDQMEGTVREAALLGTNLGKVLLGQGARKILRGHEI